MAHSNDDHAERDGDLRQVRLALNEVDHRRLRLLAAELNVTYSEVFVLGLTALATQQRGTR
jgi:hypothetical protein